MVPSGAWDVARTERCAALSLNLGMSLTAMLALIHDPGHSIAVL